jgi:hypothetical protein
MTDVFCQVHPMLRMKLIPAGRKKSDGTPYSAFYSCPHRNANGVFDCKKTIPADADLRPSTEELVDEAKESFIEDLEKLAINQPPEEPTSPPEEAKEVEVDTPMTKKDWKNKDDQITRLTLAKSFIGQGIDFENAVQNNDLDKWLNWVLGNE